VMNIPWMNGTGDVVQMFIDSCKKFGIAPGLYYNVGTNFYLNIQYGQVHNSTWIPGQKNVTLDQYEDIIVAQLTEIWGKYGDLAEIWFDGGTYSFSSTMAALLEKLQPNAIAFQGPATFANNIRWVGNEYADPPYPCWSTALSSDSYGGGSTDPSAIWAPAESDTTIRNQDKWFWTNDYYRVGIKSVDDLFQGYEAAVGRNTNFMLNLSPDPYGLVPLEDFIEYKQLGDRIRKCYGVPLQSTSGNGTSITLHFSATTVFNRIVISENQQYGQRVRSFKLLINGNTPLSDGTSIGNKYILVADDSKANSVLLSIPSSIDVPIISRFAAYYC